MYAYLCHFRIQEGDEGEGPERLRDEDVGDLAELGKVVSKIFGCHILGAASDEDLAGDLLDLSLLQACYFSL